MKATKWLMGVALLALSGCAGYQTAGEFARGRQALILGNNDAALAHFQRIANAEPQYLAHNGAFWESIWTYLGRAHYQAGKFAEARAALEKGLAQHNGDQVGRLYLGLTFARLPAAPAKTNALSAQDVSFALREGVAAERVAALVRERGITFNLNKETENQLRKAGADTRLLDEIRKIRAQAPGKGETQTARAAKELTTALTALRDDLNTFIANSTQGRFWDPGAPLRTAIDGGLKMLSAREPDWSKIISNGEWLGQKLEEEIDRARRDEAESNRRDLTR
jgi:tetratricopeptide (TPR) repeat protein